MDVSQIGRGSRCRVFMYVTYYVILNLRGEDAINVSLASFLNFFS